MHTENDGLLGGSDELGCGKLTPDEKNEGGESTKEEIAIIKEPVPSQKPEDPELLKVPEKPDFELYTSEKRRYIFELLFSLIMGLIVVTLAIAIPCILISGYDSGSAGASLLTVIIVLVGLGVLGVVSYVAYAFVQTNARKLKRLKENYIATLSMSQKKLFYSKRMKRAIAFLLVAAAVIVVLISPFVVELVRTVSVYSEAQAYIKSEDFVAAKELLTQIASSKYKDTDSLIILCKAHIEYNEGDEIYAYYQMQKVAFNYQNEEQNSLINEFRATLKNAYDENRKDISQTPQSESTVKASAPFVGMSETNIRNTSLGAPSSDVDHNYECINGEQYIANIYKFYSGTKRIFTARCVRGVVTDITDDRHSSGSSSSYRPSKDSKTDDDPYNSDYYADADDFYYNHHDDFYDYEEAEEYYNEHN